MRGRLGDITGSDAGAPRHRGSRSSPSRTARRLPPKFRTRACGCSRGWDTRCRLARSGTRSSPRSSSTRRGRRALARRGAVTTKPGAARPRRAGWTPVRRARVASGAVSWPYPARGNFVSLRTRAAGRRAGTCLRVEEERELDDLAVLDLEHLERPRLVAHAGLAGLYCPNAGAPFADTTGTTRESRQPIPGPTHQARMSSRPASHMSNGGIDCVASSWMSDVSASMS